VHKY
jgi:aryl-alcohol dehydrogenase-like predicted oxidoreductase